MKLERRIFKRKFIYRQRFINNCILRIKYGHRSDRTVCGYKMYVFKMMHNIVQKNICNYLNLLKNGTDLREIPDHDDILTDAYIMFDKCIEKYRVKKGNNFYYYLNKSLSRNFYREYKKIQKNRKIELTDAMEVVHPKLHFKGQDYTYKILCDNLGFGELEKKIIESRMNGELITEFLKKNKDITNAQYSNCMKNIKQIISDAMEEGLW